MNTPRRFRLRNVPSITTVPMPTGGVYFPRTDLCVNDMGARRTGKPPDDLVEWLDPQPSPASPSDPCRGVDATGRAFTVGPGDRPDVLAVATYDADPSPEPAKGTMGLWRKNGIDGGKYLVTRRDGTVLEHPHFVLVARDPAGPAALMAYARKAEELGFDPTYVRNVRDLAPTWHEYREAHGDGDPDAKPHRKDDPATVAKMARGGSA